MEYNDGSNWSDRDKAMKDSFESSEESKERKTNKKEKRSSAQLRALLGGAEINELPPEEADAETETKRYTPLHELLSADVRVEPAGEQKPEFSSANVSKEALLDMAETIEVHGTNLRALFEQGHLSEEDLRHLIAEYLQGRSLEGLVPSEQLTENPERLIEADHIFSDSKTSLDDGNKGVSVSGQEITSTFAETTALTPEHQAHQLETSVADAQSKERTYILIGAGLGLVIIVGFALLFLL